MKRARQRVKPARTRKRFWPAFWITFGLLAIPALAYEIHLSRVLAGYLEIEDRKKIEDKFIHGEKLLTKASFFSHPGMGEVTDITWRGSEGPAFAGSAGAAFTDMSGKLLRSVKFQKDYYCRVSFIPEARSKAARYLVGGSWSHDMALLDPQGKELWTYPGNAKGGVDGSAAGDLDGDGGLDLVVGFNGKVGLHRLDERGKKVWEEKDGNVWHVEIADTEGDGKARILNSNARGMFTVRGGDGKILRSVATDTYFCRFTMAAWPGPAGRMRAVSVGKGSVFVLDEKGASLLAFDAPGVDGSSVTTASLITLKGGHALAVCDQLAGSHLFVYDDDDRMIYHETCAEKVGALSPLRQDGNMAFLAGGEGRVWRYSLKPGADPAKFVAGGDWLSVRKVEMKDKDQLYCYNGTAKDREVRLTFPELQNTGASAALPVTARVPAGKEIRLVELRRVDLKARWNYEYKYTSTAVPKP